MPADVFIDTRDSRSNPIDDAIGQAKGAYRADVKRVWFGQYFDLDAIALAAIVGSQVPGLEVGTAAVPIGARHPFLSTAAAQTAQAATHGRFSLGLGVDHLDSSRRAAA